MQRVAILSGGGSLPMLLADNIIRGGGSAHIVAVRGEAGPQIEAYPHTWVTWGAVNAILDALKRESDGTMMIAGSVSRPDLLRLKPDLGLIRHLPKVLAMLKGGDDAVLTRLVRFFETQGLTVKGISDIAPELLADTGNLGTQLQPSDEFSSERHRDTQLGFAILDLLSDLDVGQAIAIEKGRILAIEGVEGTDRMLARIAALPGPSRPAAGTNGSSHIASGVAVKSPKRGQELRVDLPTVGSQTIARLSEARLGTLVVAAGKTLLIDRAEMIRRAEIERIAIRCVSRGAASPSAQTGNAKPSIRTWTGAMLGRRTPSAADSRDAHTAAEITQRLAAFDCGRAAVVVRDHVLAIAAAEGPVAMAQRVTMLRQWGRGRFASAAGALAVTLNSTQDESNELIALIESLAGAGLAGVAVVRDQGGRKCDLSSTAIATADRHGLFLVDIAADHEPRATGAA